MAKLSRVRTGPPATTRTASSFLTNPMKTNSVVVSILCRFPRLVWFRAYEKEALIVCCGPLTKIPGRHYFRFPFLSFTSDESSRFTSCNHQQWRSTNLVYNSTRNKYRVSIGRRQDFRLGVPQVISLNFTSPPLFTVSDLRLPS